MRTAFLTLRKCVNGVRSVNTSARQRQRHGPRARPARALRALKAVLTSRQSSKAANPGIFQHDTPVRCRRPGKGSAPVSALSV